MVKYDSFPDPNEPELFGSLSPNPHWGKQLDLDPDPHRVIGWIQTRILIETNADPQHRFRNRMFFISVI
jgi:hypothetical protein